jgi:hypothetical protein
MSVIVHPHYRPNGLGDVVGDTLHQPVLPPVTGIQFLKIAGVGLILAILLGKMGGAFRGK